MRKSSKFLARYRRAFRQARRLQHLMRGLVAVGLLIITYAQATPQDSIPVVVVADNVSDQHISRTALRAIFAMRLRTWPDGQPIRVFVLKDSYPLHIVFCKQLLNVYPHQLRSAWDRQVFSGTGQAPTEVESEEQLRDKIATTPGAIGYLWRSEVNDSVRRLEIQ